MNLAPNGKPSNLNAEQYKLVRTPAFKKWFGDWENDPENASKVVDENGEPLVVYHGSKDEFSIFDLNKVGTKTDTGMWGKGFYFSSNKKYAQTYAEKPFDYKTGKVLSEKGFIFEVFLSLKNPYLIQNTNDIPKIIVAKDTIDDLLNSDKAYSEKFRNTLIHNGFDGVFVKFEFNFKGSLPRDYELVAFQSNQIKLADGSNTTFDSNNDDIRYEQGGMVDTGKENFGKPLDCDDWTFIHETSQEDAKSILQNGFILSEKVITKGVYTIPESWKEAKLNRPNNQSIELSVSLKKGAKIFWTDSDRPTDYYYGYGNKFYIKLYKKLNKGEVSPYEAYIKINDRELWHKRKAEFCRKMEKWLKENGYCGIQQGGEIVITDLQAIKSIDVYERSDNEHYKNGGLLGGWNYSIGGL